MTESQKIIYKMAIDKLNSAMPRLGIVSGAALGLHLNKDGSKKEESKYSDWAKESDKMEKELKEAKKLFKIIESEQGS